jgi:general stress protein 26
MKNIEKSALRLVKSKKIALAGSVDEHGAPGIKAMVIEKRDGLKTFYFASNVGSQRAAQYRLNPQACLYFYNRVIYKGVMLSGIMEELTDEYHRQLIWRNGLKSIYRNGGVNDPDYCVLRFTAVSGRYWDFWSDTKSFDIR